MTCHQCETPNSPDANFCSRCGADLRAPTGIPPARTAAGDVPPPPPEDAGDTIGAIVPYRNVPALFGYYCGVFSLIPCLGLPLGLAAVPLGIAGLRRQRQHPAAKGKVHAWIAIVLGTLAIIVWGGLLLIAVIAASAQ